MFLRPAGRRRPLGRSILWGCSRTIIGQTGTGGLPSVRASCWICLICGDDDVEGGGHRLVHFFGFVAFDEMGRPAVAFEKFLQVPRGGCGRESLGWRSCSR